MDRMWLVAEQQFKQEVLKKSFLIALLSLPLFLALSIGLGALGAKLGTDSALGFVDEAAFVQQIPQESLPSGVVFRSFDSQLAAQAALNDGRIDGFYVIPADYPDKQEVELVYAEPPRWEARDAFNKVLRFNLLAGRDPELVRRVLDGPAITVDAADLGRKFPTGGPTASSFLPIIFAFVLAGLILTVSTSLMQALVEERENRVIEVMVTSISTGRMMAGKIIGILGMGLLLLASWLGIFALALWVGGTLLDVSWLQGITFNWRDLGLLALVVGPVVLFASALMVILGTLLVDTQETQQIGALSAVAFILPIYLVVFIARNPGGPLAVGFSIFPLTAVTTLAIRSIFIEIPAVQFLAATAVGLASGLLLVWLAGKALRANMLNYGKRWRLRRSRQDRGPLVASREG